MLNILASNYIWHTNQFEFIEKSWVRILRFLIVQAGHDPVEHTQAPDQAGPNLNDLKI